MSSKVVVRTATEDDVETIYEMIVALAVYEKEPDAVTGSVEMLREGMFGERVHAEALIASIDDKPVGLALFHGTYSTWECLPGLWLEDFFVDTSYRRAGIGETLFRTLARLAVERGCSRMAWTALDWNEPAVNFYAKMGAEVLSDWTTRRLSGESLRAVAAAG